jgi:aspartate beta-hydroxylase
MVPRNYEHSFLSALAPTTHVWPHHGPTNKKLRCQLPLLVPPTDEGCHSWLRVNDQLVRLEEGKCIVFDDSFEHEAMNESSTTPRIILIFDIWHPDLSDSEVRFLTYLSRQRQAAWKRLGINTAEEAYASAGNQEETKTEEVIQNTDFYSVITSGRRAKSRVSIEEVWGSG